VSTAVGGDCYSLGYSVAREPGRGRLLPPHAFQVSAPKPGAMVATPLIPVPFHLFQFHVHGVVDYFLVFIGITLPVQIEN
jgi:hypothetical protein